MRRYQIVKKYQIKAHLLSDASFGNPIIIRIPWSTHAFAPQETHKHIHDSRCFVSESDAFFDFSKYKSYIVYIFVWINTFVSRDDGRKLISCIPLTTQCMVAEQTMPWYAADWSYQLRRWPSTLFSQVKAIRNSQRAGIQYPKLFSSSTYISQLTLQSNSLICLAHILDFKTMGSRLKNQTKQITTVWNGDVAWIRGGGGKFYFFIRPCLFYVGYSNINETISILEICTQYPPPPVHTPWKSDTPISSEHAHYMKKYLRFRGYVQGVIDVKHKVFRFIL